jgi:hypothetical protein
MYPLAGKLTSTTFGARQKLVSLRRLNFTSFLVVVVADVKVLAVAALVLAVI